VPALADIRKPLSILWSYA